MTYQHPGDVPPPDRGSVGGGALEVFGELGIWFLICGAGAVGIFLLRKSPVITTVLLVVVGAGVLALAFVVTRRAHPEGRRWWSILLDAFVAILATASVLFLLTWGCSCP